MAVIFSLDFTKPEKAEIGENGFYLENKGSPAVLLIHGLTGTPHEMRFLANYLNKKGFAVLCPRLANHGEPMGIFKKSKWQEFYESVRQAFLKLEAEDNTRPILVGGLSMGALLALLLAEEFPDRISGASCLSPTLFYDGWNVPWTKCFLPLAYWTPLKHIAYFKEEPPYGIKNETVRQKVHEYYNKADIHKLEGFAKYGYPYFPVTLFCELKKLIAHLTKKLPNVRVPVQLIQSKDDDMTSVKNSQFIYDRIQSETKEIFLLYNSYHVVTADHERETVAQEMESFFNRILNRKPAEMSESLETEEDAF